ncbi:LPS assembly lipoprotein LptE [Opitutus terrae]|uniref:Lipoprotein n=1 Tax=Opitutus terrae (strain DSM 11246 / JCM 15787 / PB90-1) TaxID=452637 RepID=B1ZWC8_OPITP|nr:LPS assembly lipoprotein LptE [Opitutus terrae]ACB76880.1 hypothetical protein Oter_3603 [Opitutus terrae PB90-1]
MSLRLPVLGLLAALLCCCGWAGCSHYQLGTRGQLTFATLYVEPAENTTLLPQARALLSTQVREALARDGRVTLVNSAEAADATLRLVIRDYHRDMASVQERDTGLARKFMLTLGVDCTLRDNRSGKDLFTNRRVTTQRDAFTDGGQLQSEYQALPLLAESLGQKIAHAVLDVW